MQYTRHQLILAALVLVAGAAGCMKNKGTATDADAEADVEDEDAAAETVEDPPEDTGPDTVEDVTDVVDEDVPTDTGDEDAVTDVVDEDVAADVVDEDVAADVVDEDVAADVVDEDADAEEDGSVYSGPGGTSCTDTSIVPVTVPADLPWEDLSATNCSMGDDYGATCLDNYDGGEDILYRLDVTASTEVNVQIDPKGTDWTGVALDSSCPLGTSTCIATSTRSGTGAHDVGCQTLTAGTYWIMVDTWPSPTCIPDFDLRVFECVCSPGETRCADAVTLQVCNLVHTWDDETCINACGDTGGGVYGCLPTSSETEPNGDSTEALTNNLVTVPWDGLGEIASSTDEDYYAFTLTSAATVTIETAEYGTPALGDSRLWLYESTFTVESPPTCTPSNGCIEFDDNDGPALYSRIEDVALAAGTYYVRVTGYSSSYTGIYRLTIWVI